MVVPNLEGKPAISIYFSRGFSGSRLVYQSVHVNHGKSAISKVGFPRKQVSLTARVYILMITWRAEKSPIILLRKPGFTHHSYMMVPWVSRLVYPRIPKGNDQMVNIHHDALAQLHQADGSASLIGS